MAAKTALRTPSTSFCSLPNAFESLDEFQLSNIAERYNGICGSQNDLPDDFLIKAYKSNNDKYSSDLQRCTIEMNGQKTEISIDDLRKDIKSMLKCLQLVLSYKLNLKNENIESHIVEIILSINSYLNFDSEEECSNQKNSEREKSTKKVLQRPSLQKKAPSKIPNFKDFEIKRKIPSGKFSCFEGVHLPSRNPLTIKVISLKRDNLNLTIDKLNLLEHFNAKPEFVQFYGLCISSEKSEIWFFLEHMNFSIVEIKNYLVQKKEKLPETIASYIIRITRQACQYLNNIPSLEINLACMYVNLKGEIKIGDFAEVIPIKNQIRTEKPKWCQNFVKVLDELGDICEDAKYLNEIKLSFENPNYQYDDIINYELDNNSDSSVHDKIIDIVENYRKSDLFLEYEIDYHCQKLIEIDEKNDKSIESIGSAIFFQTYKYHAYNILPYEDCESKKKCNQFINGPSSPLSKIIKEDRKLGIYIDSIKRSLQRYYHKRSKEICQTCSALYWTFETFEPGDVVKEKLKELDEELEDYCRTLPPVNYDDVPKKLDLDKHWWWSKKYIPG